MVENLVQGAAYEMIPETAVAVDVENTHTRVVRVDGGGEGDYHGEPVPAGRVRVRRLRRSERVRCMTAAGYSDAKNAADQERLLALEVRMAIESCEGMRDEFGVEVPANRLREKHPVLGDIASVEVFDALSHQACLEAYTFCTSGVRLVHAKNSGAPRGTSPGGASTPVPVPAGSGAPTSPASVAPGGPGTGGGVGGAALCAGAGGAGNCGKEVGQQGGQQAGEICVPGAGAPVS